MLRHFSTGLIVELSEKEKDALRNSIKAKTEIEAFGLYADYQWRVNRFTHYFVVELLNESMGIELKDQSVSNELTFQDDSISSSLLYKLSYPLTTNIDLSMELGARRGDWKFSPIGKLSGSRSWFGLGLRYHFSFEAKTL